MISIFSPFFFQKEFEIEDQPSSPSSTFPKRKAQLDEGFLTGKDEESLYEEEEELIDPFEDELEFQAKTRTNPKTEEADEEDEEWDEERFRKEEEEEEKEENGEDEFPEISRRELGQSSQDSNNDFNSLDEWIVEEDSDQDFESGNEQNKEVDGNMNDNSGYSWRQLKR